MSSRGQTTSPKKRMVFPSNNRRLKNREGVTMVTFKPPQLPLRKDVQDFIVAAETLLAPILRETELTPEECHLISEYLTTMCRDNHPWSSHFKSTVSGQASSKTADKPPRLYKP